MQIRTGTVDVAAGASRVVASEGVDWSAVTVGSLFSVPGVEPRALYDILSVTPPESSIANRWEIELSNVYYGPSNAAAHYQISVDFTPTLGMPLIQHGDVDTALLVNRALRILDNTLAGPGGDQGFTFLQAKDTPNSYNNAGGKLVRVKEDLTGLEFVAFGEFLPDETITLASSAPVVLAPGWHQVTAAFGGSTGGAFSSDVVSFRGTCSELTFLMMPQTNGSNGNRVKFLVNVPEPAVPGDNPTVTFSAKVRGPGFTPYGPVVEAYPTNWSFLPLEMGGSGGEESGAPENIDPPYLMGDNWVGGSMACNIGSWAGDPMPAFDYQWTRNNVAIAGATNANFTPTQTGPHACVVHAVNEHGEAWAESNSVEVLAEEPGETS